jgi:drug/metabolite transporter (DMT)-like permease
MVKGCSPVLTLFVSWLLGVRQVTKSDILSVTIIAGGVVLASAGEIHFSVIGVVYQLAGLLFEATRVVLIQLMLTGEDVSLDPIVGLYYYAPFCAALNFCIMWVVEIPHLSVAEVAPVTWVMLFGSAVIAFMLNYTSMALVSDK